MSVFRRINPCDRCQFRTDSEPGDLDGDDPVKLAHDALYREDIPCRKDIDPDAEDQNAERHRASMCAGHLRFLNNMCHTPRNVRQAIAAKQLPDHTAKVFKTTAELIEHHGGPPNMGEWEVVAQHRHQTMCGELCGDCANRCGKVYGHVVHRCFTHMRENERHIGFGECR